MDWIGRTVLLVVLLLLPLVARSRSLADEAASDEAAPWENDDDNINVSATTQSFFGSTANVNLSAAEFAAKAAQMAMAANDAQSNEAASASKQVKIQLANKAIQASKAVQGVLACKRALVDKFHTQWRTSEAFSTFLRTSLQNSARHVQKIERGLDSSVEHLNRLSQVQQKLNHSLCSDVAALADVAQADFNHKRQLLGTAKQRNDRLQSQLDCVRREYDQVKLAAYQAARAASEARQKAAAAADRGCHNVMRQRRRHRAKKISKQQLRSI